MKCLPDSIFIFSGRFGKQRQEHRLCRANWLEICLICICNSDAFPVEFPSGHPVCRAGACRFGWNGGAKYQAAHTLPRSLLPRLPPSFASSININAYSPSHTSRDSRGGAGGGDDFVLPLPLVRPSSALSEQSGSSHESRSRSWSQGGYPSVYPMCR